MRLTLIALAVVLAVTASPSLAETLDQRLDQVGKIVDEADSMFRSAMKGHLPSVQVINDLRAKLALAQQLYKDAEAETGDGKSYEAGAKLDAAEFLAQQVFEASEH